MDRVEQAILLCPPAMQVHADPREPPAGRDGLVALPHDAALRHAAPRRDTHDVLGGHTHLRSSAGRHNIKWIQEMDQIFGALLVRIGNGSTLGLAEI